MLNLRDVDSPQHVLIERLREQLGFSITRGAIQAMSLEQYEDYLRSTLVTVLKRRVLAFGKQDEVATKFTHVPETWWDAFKLAHFPLWARDRWPAGIRSIAIEYRTSYERVCPHHDVGRADSEAHITFMLTGLPTPDEFEEREKAFRAGVEAGRRSVFGGRAW